MKIAMLFFKMAKIVVAYIKLTHRTFIISYITNKLTSCKLNFPVL